MNPPDPDKAALRAALRAIPPGPAPAPKPEQLARWLDGQLPPAEAAAVERALAADPTLREWAAAVRLASAVDLPARDASAIESAVLGAVAENNVVAFTAAAPASARWHWLVAAAAAAAVLAPSWTLGRKLEATHAQQETAELRALLADPFGLEAP